MPDWTTLGHIVRPRGVRGEVIAKTGDWTPEQLLGFAGVHLQPAGREVGIESAWRQKDRMVLKFEGIDSVEQAEVLRGAELCIPKQERPPAPEGEVYFSDLVGCRVIEKESGEDLGAVADYHEYGGPVVLEVRGQGKEILIPFVAAICQEIDVAARRILVVLPEGLKEL